MHYPHKVSTRHRKKKVGFLNRMKAHHGRKMLNRKRKAGRRVQVI